MDKELKEIRETSHEQNKNNNREILFSTPSNLLLSPSSEFFHSVIVIIKFKEQKYWNKA